MDDPNGVIQHNGQFHLFYQWIADSTHRNGAPFHWGHAVSDDLVHWRDLPVAISPTPDGPDQTGCWSGSSVIDDGVPTCIYTGHGDTGFGVCLATADNDMRVWRKHPASPVIHQPLEAYGFPGNDPYVWRDEESWCCVLTGGVKDVGGVVLLYRSDNLIDWRFVGPLLTGTESSTGSGWEFANVFELDGQYVLTVSGGGLWKSFYFVGDMTGDKFTPRHVDLIDAGGHFYAPYTFIDDHGRRIQYGWSWEGRHEDDYLAAGWSGVHTIGRVLSVRDDNTLGFEPIEEIETLRGDCIETAGSLTAAGDMVEIIVEFATGDWCEAGLIVRASADLQEQTRIVCNRAAGTLCIDRSRASLDPSVHQHVYRTEPIAKSTGGPFVLQADEPLKLRVFVDRSIIEVFANSRMVLTSRVYPTRNDCVHVGSFGARGTVRIWQMQPIWPVSRSIPGR